MSLPRSSSSQDDTNSLKPTNCTTNQLKKFTTHDIITYEDNAQVIQTFLRFFIALAFCPIATFYAAQYFALSLRLPAVTDGTVVGFSVSLIVVLFLMAAYAYRAYQEEKQDYFSEHREDTRPLFSPSLDSAFVSKKSQ